MPDGSLVVLEAIVNAGKDKKAGETFLYRKGDVCNASYRITGTTLINSLKGPDYTTPPTEDNVFSFETNFVSGECVRFDVTGHKITDRQVFQGLFLVMGRNAICVRASRQSSTPVAEWFNQRTNLNAVTRTFADYQPSDLYFAISGTLTLTTSTGTYVSPEMCIGQGSRNNWWIGSGAMSAIKWKDRGTADLESGMKSLLTLGVAAKTKNAGGIAGGGVGYIEALVNSFTPNSRGTGLMVFRRPKDNSRHLFAIEMSDDCAWIKHLEAVT